MAGSFPFRVWKIVAFLVARKGEVGNVELCRSDY